MWAQVILTRLRPGRAVDLPKLAAMLRAIEQPGSGLVRSTLARDQKEPDRVLMFVVFESEEKARAREADPRRAEGLSEVRALMQEMFEGAPEFIDLNVEEEVII